MVLLKANFKCQIFIHYLFSGSPYLGKPSDMWALGVVLFTMLYGQFPFYDSVPQELFRKIKAADFKIPK
jgi:serine/threonine-protein kinase 40